MPAIPASCLVITLQQIATQQTRPHQNGALITEIGVASGIRAREGLPGCHGRVVIPNTAETQTDAFRRQGLRQFSATATRRRRN